MTVAVFSESTLWGGLEVHAVSFTAGLIRLGHRASIVCLSPETHALYLEHAPPDVPVVQCARPARPGLLGWWRALGRVEADAAVLEKGTLRTGSVALDAALRLRFSTFVAIMHIEPPALPARSSRRYLGGLVPGLAFWWYRWKWTGYLRSLGPRKTVCVSESVRRRLIGDYAFSPDRVVTVTNGVDAAVFRPDEAARVRLRREWGVPDDAFVFGSVGRLTRPKGLDVAIAAFAQMASNPTETASRPYLVLVGTGEEREALVAQALSLGVHDRVVFPGFAASPRASYQAFDVFLIPSRFEAMPFSLLEAMACGCQIIASRVGGIPDVIVRDELGALVPPEDTDALSREMQQALARTVPDRDRRSLAARQRVIEAFDAHQHCVRIAALLEGDDNQPTVVVNRPERRSA